MSLLPQVVMPMPNPSYAVGDRVQRKWPASFVKKHGPLKPDLQHGIVAAVGKGSDNRGKPSPAVAFLADADDDDSLAYPYLFSEIEPEPASYRSKNKRTTVPAKVRLPSRMRDNPADRDPDMPWQRMRAIVHAGKVRGRPLTDKQRRFFMAEVRRRTPNLSAKQARALAKAWAKRTGEPWKGNPAGEGLQAALRLVAGLQGDYDAAVPGEVLRRHLTGDVIRALLQAGLLDYDERSDDYAVSRRGWTAHGRRNPMARKNPSADERRRLLERAAMQGDPLAAARLAEERRRTTADPALAAERLYLRDILKGWGVEQKGGAYTGSSSDGYVPSSAAAAGLRAVFKKAGIKAQIKTSGHGDLLLYWNSSADGAKLGRLFAQNIWERANSHTVHPNAREDRSDLMTDYYSPGGVTLPQEYHATYADAVRTALGQKATLAEKREAKRDERRKAVMEAGAAPRANDLGKGERVVLHGSGGYDGTWEVYNNAAGVGGNMLILHRVGKTGKLLSLASGNNSIYVSHKNWDKLVESKVARVAPRMNPPLAIIHNPGIGNPHAVRGCRLGRTAKGGMTLDEARAEIESLAAWGHTEALREIVRRTRPRDRDKLVAEIQFAQRSSSQRSSAGGAGGSPRAANPRNPIGHQRGGKREKISFDEAVAAGIDKAPGFKEAVAHYRKFHGTDPTTVEVYRYDDGRRERSERVVVTMGEVPETHYTMKPNAKSNKAGYHWVHKHVEKGKGRNPNLLFDPATGLMTIAGGTFKVTRWIYH